MRRPIGFAIAHLLVLLLLILEPAALRAAEPAQSSPENEAWNAFCERLKAVGGEILRGDLPASDLDRAEGQRYLLQRLAATIDEALDAESGPPLVSLYSHKLRKFGMDSADAKYSTARIQGDGTYRLSGTLGTAHHIAFQLATSRAGWQSFESISRDDLHAEPSGDFEVLVSAKKPTDWKKPWLPLDPRSSELILREYFYDWANERPSDFRIERLDRPEGESVPIGGSAIQWVGSGGRSSSSSSMDGDSAEGPSAAAAESADSLPGAAFVEVSVVTESGLHASDIERPSARPVKRIALRAPIRGPTVGPRGVGASGSPAREPRG